MPLPHKQAPIVAYCGYGINAQTVFTQKTVRNFPLSALPAGEHPLKDTILDPRQMLFSCATMRLRSWFFGDIIAEYKVIHDPPY